MNNDATPSSPASVIALDSRARARVARRILRWAALAGLFASLYLLFEYVTGGPIRCGVSGACEIVRASRWAYPFGIPTPLLGAFFYTSVLGLLMLRVFEPARWTQRLHIALVALATSGFAASIFLTGVEAFDLKAYCRWCVGSAIAATIIFIAAWFDDVALPDEKPTALEMRRYFIDLAIATVIGVIAMVWLTAKPAQDVPRPDLIAALGSVSSTGMLLPPDVPIEGPLASKVTIVEFLDFRCPGCAAYEPVLKKIRKEYYGKIRFASRQFPLVESHPYSKGAAIAAVCSMRQGQYFVYAETLFKNRDHLTRQDLERYAGDLGLDSAKFKICLDDPEALNNVIRDRMDGQLLGVDSTPTIFINGKLYQNVPLEDQLRSIITKALK